MRGAVRVGQPAEAVVGRAMLPQLPLLPQLPPHAAPAAPAPTGSKRPRWVWNQSKNNILPKNQTKVQTLDCARSDLLLCLSDIYSVTWANSLQIYTVQWKCSQTTVNCTFAGHVSEQTDLAN